MVGMSSFDATEEAIKAHVDNVHWWMKEKEWSLEHTVRFLSRSSMFTNKVWDRVKEMVSKDLKGG